MLETAATINDVEVKNRVVRSATHGSLGEEGYVTDRLIKALVRLAEGGVGLTVTGAAAIAPEGRISDTQLGIWDDSFLPGLKRLTEAIHEVNGARVAIQISHAGPHARVGDERPLAPSPVKTLALGQPPRALMEDEIERILGDYVAGAERVRAAGADAVQFHMCHGDLPTTFLSPRTNKRQDRWGGSLENRMRFPREIVRRTREAVGPDYAIMVKMNASCFQRGGWTIGDAEQLAQALAEDGVDAIEVSAGTSETWMAMAHGDVPLDAIVETIGGGVLQRLVLRLYFARSARRFRFREAYLLPYALRIKQAAPQTAVIAVGGMRTRETMESALAQGVDFVALSRPLIREPNLINKLLSGDQSEAKCVNCNRCVVLVGAQGHPLRCYYRRS